MLCCPLYDFRVKYDNRFVFTHISFGGVLLFMLFVSIYIYWCPNTISMSDHVTAINTNRTGVNSGSRIDSPSGELEFTPTPIFVACVLINTYLTVLFLKIIVKLVSFRQCIVCPSSIYGIRLLFGIIKFTLSLISHRRVFDRELS